MLDLMKKWHHTKVTIYRTKSQGLLTNVDIKTSSLISGMIARTKCHVFTEIYPAVLPLKQPFWSARLMFCILWFSKQKLSSSTRWFHRKTLGVVFFVNTAQNWYHPFIWILLYCNFLRFTLLSSFDWKLP